MRDLPVKVLIVDDEPLARRRIRGLLANHEEMEVIAECANGIEAIAAIENHTPDLMFLDMQMPEMDGLTLLKAETDKPMPLVIIVTAYKEHGLAAFEAHAVDYLLKPYDQQRFEKAIEKAKMRLSFESKDDSPNYLSEIINKIESPKKYRQNISIRQDGHVFLIKTENIEWIEAERNYVRLYAGRESYLRREAISAIEEQFNPAQFRRVHRSIIVNLNFVKELQSTSSGDYQIILHSGKKLVLSRTYQKNLPEFFK